jgi:ABC-type uncharacterized transport system substrate-binding protein
VERRLFVGLLRAATLWAGVGQAQPAPPVVGFMSGRAPVDSEYLVAAFQQGLSEAGFVDGKNVVIEYRWASGQYDRLPALAADLVKRQVALITAIGGDVSAVAAKQATSTIPVVFGMGGDPIKAGLVDSLSRPGGNATGYTLLTNELEPKRLGLLRDLLPGLGLIAVLVYPNFPPAAGQVAALEKAAQLITTEHRQRQQRCRT